MLERNAWLGGAINTAEITLPGYHHDVFSGWHPLFLSSKAYRILKEDLEAAGLEYCEPRIPAAAVFPDGTSAFIMRSEDGNAEEFQRFAPGDGIAWRNAMREFAECSDLAFGLLGTELWSFAGLRWAARTLFHLGRRGTLLFMKELLSTARDWLTGTFNSDEARGLLAPWVLHAGLGPDAASSGFMAKMMAWSLQTVGLPVPKGGGSRLVDALVRIIEAYGGQCRTDADVSEVIVADRKALGVRTADGRTFLARRAVLCNVTPTQLYARLLPAGTVQSELIGEAKAFRYGRADMHIHYALSEPPRWIGDPRLAQAAIVHVTPGLDGVSRAVNEAERGLLPAEPTIVCGQPVAVDPSRAPAGASILWIQLQELPSRPQGDAAGEIDVGGGTWTEELRERYADRIEALLSRHIVNLRNAKLRRVVLSPADLEGANINLVGGDPYSGALALDQNFLLRPLASQPGHRTAVKRLWQIGASTHPGPGLGAGSGTIVAETLLRQHTRNRYVAAARTLVALAAAAREVVRLLRQ